MCESGHLESESTPIVLNVFLDLNPNPAQKTLNPDLNLDADSHITDSPVHRGSKVEVESIRCFFAYSYKGPTVSHSHAILPRTKDPFHLNNNLQTNF